MVDLDAERNIHAVGSNRLPVSSKAISSTETTVFDEELAPAQLKQFAIEATLQTSSASVTKRYDRRNHRPRLAYRVLTVVMTFDGVPDFDTTNSRQWKS